MPAPKHTARRRLPRLRIVRGSGAISNSPWRNGCLCPSRPAVRLARVGPSRTGGWKRMRGIARMGAAHERRQTMPHHAGGRRPRGPSRSAAGRHPATRPAKKSASRNSPAISASVARAIGGAVARLEAEGIVEVSPRQRMFLVIPLRPLSGTPSCSIDKVSIPIENLSARQAMCISADYSGSTMPSTPGVNLRFQINPFVRVGTSFDSAYGGRVSGEAGVRHGQLNIGAACLLSNATDLFMICAYQHASGTDSPGRPAVAAIGYSTRSAANHQVLVRAGIKHDF